MDKENDLLVGDDYSFHVPLLEKSVSVDENGDYIVQGVMTSDDTDEEDDSITPEGMDCSYFLEKGWVKYEHGKNPNQFIGEPLEVKVGRFEHPTLKKSVNGIFVKARLFQNRELTKEAITAINDLEKSQTRRRMGWSIEGNVVKRHPKTGKVIKSVLRNVVLTMNPVNTTTWAELAKSFAKEHELVDVDEPIDKAMDLAGAQAITPQSLEGSSEEDPQKKWIELFRATVKKALMEKSFGAQFIASVEDAENLAFSEALAKGLDYEEADEYASYIVQKHDLLKSVVINFGGEKMSKDTENKLAGLLDADLEELQKSIEADEESSADETGEDDELEKAIDEDGDEESSGDEDGSDEGEDEEENEEVEKSFRTDLTKSMADEHGQAFEVSDFLASLTDEIGFSLEGMEKSIMGVTKNQHAVTKTLVSLGELVKSLHTEITAVRAENEELTKSFGEVLNRPVGRKSVVNQREVQTLTKSFGNTAPKNLTRSQIGNELMKSFDAGEISGSVITRFEGGVSLDQLNLPEAVKERIFGQ